MLSTSQTDFIQTIARGEAIHVNAGHMLYRRLIVDHPVKPWFIKAHDSSLFTIESKRSEALRYLEKEANVYQHLRDMQFAHIPMSHHFSDGVLLLSGLTEQDGWHWKIPSGHNGAKYVVSALNALEALQSIDTHHMFDTEPSANFFWQEGWGSDKSMLEAIRSHKHIWSSRLRENSNQSLERLAMSLTTVQLSAPLPVTGHISHHDIRQSNLAWHPVEGTVLVDWSWASHGVHNADATMLLIDLHKSGVDVSLWLPTHFNADYAKLLIGYWLLRVGEPSAQGNDVVRLQQLVSAISAFELVTAVTTTIQNRTP